jgi:3-phenylpropionate/trans-cinnamate dioxygenase ferredoxin component
MSAQPVLKLSDLPDVGAVQVRIDGRPLSVVRAEDGSLHAIDDICTHANVSLSEGEVEDTTIECWLHGSRFDLRTGEPTGLPATVPVGVYAVTIEGDDVLVDISAPLNLSTTSTSKEH